jgi:hypothetical protein
MSHTAFGNAQMQLFWPWDRKGSTAQSLAKGGKCTSLNNESARKDFSAASRSSRNVGFRWRISEQAVESKTIERNVPNCH